MKNLLFFLLFAVCCQLAAAQGILLDDEEYLAAPYDNETRSAAPGGKKSLLENDEPPPILSQGEIPICSGCAIAMATAIKHRFYCQKFCGCKKSPVAFSMRYVYNQVRDRATGLVSMRRALDTLVSQGICPAANFPNNSDALPNAAQRRAASNFKCWEYVRIFRLREEVADHPDSLRQFQEEFVEKTITAIDNHRPVLVGLAITPDFKHLSTDDCLWSPPDPLVLFDWHALVLVAYDDQAEEFTLLNSYGKKWGCEGMARISYDDFGRVARYGYSLMIIPPFGEEVECGK